MYTGGWNLPTFFVFFLLGCLLATDERYRSACERHRIVAYWASALLGVSMLATPDFTPSRRETKPCLFLGPLDG